MLRIGSIIIKWAEELRATVTTKRGDAVFHTLSSEISRLAHESKSFPTTKMVEVEAAGGHAEAEVVVDRLDGWFVATWSDVTEREDGRRFRAPLSDTPSDTPRVGGDPEMHQVIAPRGL